MLTWTFPGLTRCTLDIWEPGQSANVAYWNKSYTDDTRNPGSMENYYNSKLMREDINEM